MGTTVSGLTIGKKYLMIALATYSTGDYVNLTYNHATTETVYRVNNYGGTSWFHSFCFAIVIPTAASMTFSCSSGFKLLAWFYEL